MEATKTSSPILSSELYSKLVNTAIQSFEDYMRLTRSYDQIPISPARLFIAEELNREYQRELQKIPNTGQKKRGRFRTTLWDIAEAAAMRLDFERKKSYINKNSYAWVR